MISLVDRTHEAVSCFLLCVPNIPEIRCLDFPDFTEQFRANAGKIP
jgi:hypothetical protein